MKCDLRQSPRCHPVQGRLRRWLWGRRFLGGPKPSPRSRAHTQIHAARGPRLEAASRCPSGAPGHAGPVLHPTQPQARETGATSSPVWQWLPLPVSPATLPSSGGSAVAHGPDSCALGGPGRAAQTLRSLRRAAHAALVRLSRAERARCMEPKPTRGLVPEAPLLELLSARTLHGANCHVQVCRKCLTLAAVISQCDRWRRSHRRALPTSAPPESVLQAPGAASCL